MDISILSPFGQWASESVKIEGKSTRILAAAAGEFIVLGRYPLLNVCIQPHLWFDRMIYLYAVVLCEGRGYIIGRCLFAKNHQDPR